MNKYFKILNNILCYIFIIEFLIITNTASTKR